MGDASRPVQVDERDSGELRHQNLPPLPRLWVHSSTRLRSSERELFVLVGEEVRCCWVNPFGMGKSLARCLICGAWVMGRDKRSIV